MMFDIYTFQLLGFSLSVLLDIDPNPDNFVSAGIMYTRGAQIGILARLEPNKQAQVSHNVKLKKNILMIL